MAQKRGTSSKGTTPSKSGGKSKRNNKQPTQKTPMQRVAIMGPTGKVRFEWRVWTN